jgi:hypothetical protein
MKKKTTVNFTLALTSIFFTASYAQKTLWFREVLMTDWEVPRAIPSGRILRCNLGPMAP